MVTFSCDGCAEMLKKNQVDAHARRCRDCASVSCVDCSVSFWGDDYRSHTSCITEAERYEKTVYKGPRKNDTSNRKLTPQENWMNVINDSLNTCPPNLKCYIELIATCENVPRKERPFRNFASNSLKLRGSNGDIIISALWKHFNDLRQKQTAEREESNNKKSPSKDNLSKEQISSNTEDNDSSSSEPKSKSDVVATKLDKEDEKSSLLKLDERKKVSKAIKKALKKALKKAPNRQLKLKQLRKIVKDQVVLRETLKQKNELNTLISEAITKSEKSVKIEGKLVSLIED